MKSLNFLTTALYSACRAAADIAKSEGFAAEMVLGFFKSSELCLSTSDVCTDLDASPPGACLKPP